MTLLLLCALLGVQKASAGDGCVLKVMTFNIRYGTADDKDDAWVHRRRLLFEVFKREDCDLVGLQEALRFQIDELLTEFPRYSFLGVGRDADGGGEYSAILYDKHRFDVKRADTFWLSETENRQGSMTWGNSLPRICTWAQFRDQKCGREFYFFNTHWDHVSQNSRDRSAELIRDRTKSLNEIGDPVIVTGDFNVGAGDTAWSTLLGAKLTDSFRDVYPDKQDVGTFHAFTGIGQGAKIDAIFVSPHWQVKAAEVNRFQRAGRYPSDHFPVTAAIMLGEGRGTADGPTK